nr:MAG TPA: hypothetical protein [Caudoviricetes sp.]
MELRSPGACVSIAGQGTVRFSFLRRLLRQYARL